MEKLKIAGQNGWAFWRPGPWSRLGWNPEHRWKVWHLDQKDLPSFKIRERDFYGLLWSYVWDRGEVSLRSP